MELISHFMKKHTFLYLNMPLNCLYNNHQDGGSLSYKESPNILILGNILLGNILSIALYYPL